MDACGPKATLGALRALHANGLTFRDPGRSALVRPCYYSDQTSDLDLQCFS